MAPSATKDDKAAAPHRQREAGRKDREKAIRAKEKAASAKDTSAKDKATSAKDKERAAKQKDEERAAKQKQKEREAKRKEKEKAAKQKDKERAAKQKEKEKAAKRKEQEKAAKQKDKERAAKRKEKERAAKQPKDKGRPARRKDQERAAEDKGRPAEQEVGDAPVQAATADEAELPAGDDAGQPTTADAQQLTTDDAGQPAAGEGAPAGDPLPELDVPPSDRTIRPKGYLAEALGKEDAVERSTQRATLAASYTTRDHDVIRAWAQTRGGRPADVAGTGRRGAGVLRIEFPDGPGDDSRLEDVDWSAFFATFDESDVDFLYQERVRTGDVSRFHKIVRAAG